MLGHIEGAGSSVGGIVQALEEQVAACGSVVESLKSVASGTTSHEATAQRLGTATNASRDQANRLRDEVARFVLE